MTLRALTKTSGKKGITNVLGALLFVLAIVLITGLIATISNEFGNYVRSADYLYNIERERSNEDLVFSHSFQGGALYLNLTNCGGVSLNLVRAMVVEHDGSSDILAASDGINILLNPGMSRLNYNASDISNANLDFSSVNATILFISTRGNSFVVVVRDGQAYYS